MSDTKLPFIFARVKPNVKACLENIDCWVVIISEPVFEYGFDPIDEYKNLLIIPENNIEDKRAEKTFPTLEEARNAVHDWWLAQSYISKSN